MEFTFSGPVLAQALVSGIMLGGLFGLISLGLTLTWGVMKVINFAHGQFLMVALYMAYFLVSGSHIDPYLSVLITVPAMAIMGVFIFKSTLQPILKDPVMNLILLTMGLGIVLQNLALAVFGADTYMTETVWTTRQFNIGSVVVGVPQLIGLAGSVLCAVGVGQFLSRTDLGRSMRAAAQDPKAAMLMGVNVRRVYLYAFALGSGIVGLAASLMIPFYYATPTAGLTLGLMAFVVVVLGGMGNLMGCFVAGIIMGLAEALGAAVLPGSLSRVFFFAVFISLLILKPQGILARRTA